MSTSVSISMSVSVCQQLNKLMPEKGGRGTGALGLSHVRKVKDNFHITRASHKKLQPKSGQSLHV